MQQRARTDLNLKSLRLNRHAVIPLVFRVSLEKSFKRQSNIIANTRNRHHPLHASDVKQSNGKTKRHEETRRAISYQRMSHPNIYAKE
mgnify:CR=1 FL=1